MNLLFALLVGLSIFLIMPASQRSKKLKNVDAVARDLTTAELVESLRMCLQAGLTLNRSFKLLLECGFTSPLLRKVNANISVGLPALHQIESTSNNYGVNLLIPILERSMRTGGSVDASLEVLAQQLRAETHAQRVRLVRSVAVKSVLPLGFCFLPAFVLVGVVPIAASLGSSLIG